MFSFGKKVVWGIVALSIIAFFAFTFSRYSPYLRGPELGEGNFQEFLNLSDPSYHLLVSVERTKSAFLNGRELSLKVEGEGQSRRVMIDEELFFHSPYDTGVIRLVDSFDHERVYPFSVWVSERE